MFHKSIKLIQVNVGENLAGEIADGHAGCMVYGEISGVDDRINRFNRGMGESNFSKIYGVEADNYFFQQI